MPLGRNRVCFSIRLEGFNTSHDILVVASDGYPIVPTSFFAFASDAMTIKPPSTSPAGPDSGALAEQSDFVSDAFRDSWVHAFLPRRVWPYAQLARWERPIGSWLLLWPCLWSFALAHGVAWGREDTPLAFDPGAIVLGFAAFFIGAIAMRGAGCTYNDIVDQGIDGQVERTASRPLPSGRVDRRGAMLFIVAQAIVGLLALLTLCSIPGLPAGSEGGFNAYAFVLALASLAIVFFYPFAKRITDWPQLVLGLAFSWGALMGWAVTFGTLAAPAFWLYVGSIAWVIGYDTIYAHQDREDDALIGVRSTARLFGENTRPALFGLYIFALVSFAVAAWTAGADWPAYVGLALGAAQMVNQLRSLDINDADLCLKLFQSNSQFGWLVFVGFASAAILNLI